MEALSIAKSKSAFSLTERLLRHCVAYPKDATSHESESHPDGTSCDDLEENDEWFMVDGVQVNHHFKRNEGCVGVGDEVSCPTKSDRGNRELRAQFGRRCTHNEQTLVRPCGVIAAHATFFGAEAVSNVLVSYRHYICIVY